MFTRKVKTKDKSLRIGSRNKKRNGMEGCVTYLATVLVRCPVEAENEHTRFLWRKVENGGDRLTRHSVHPKERRSAMRWGVLSMDLGVIMGVGLDYGTELWDWVMGV